MTVNECCSTPWLTTIAGLAVLEDYRADAAQTGQILEESFLLWLSTVARSLGDFKFLRESLGRLTLGGGERPLHPAIIAIVPEDELAGHVVLFHGGFSGRLLLGLRQCHYGRVQERETRVMKVLTRSY